MKLYRKDSFTGIELLVVISVLGVAGTFFGSKLHIPFVETKADVQKKLDQEKVLHNIDKEQLKSANELIQKQKELLVSRDSADEKQGQLTQSASNAVAKITAVGQIVPPVTRRDVVVDNAAQEAAKALPPPTDYAAILKATQDALDEAKTSNAALQAQHAKDMGVIEGQRKDLSIALAEVDARQRAVDEQKRLNDQQKAQNAAQKRLLGAQEGILNDIRQGFDRVKYSLMGLVGLAGIVCISIGSVVNKKLMIIKGITLIILAVAGMLIPIEVYLGLVGLALLVAGAYVAHEWHTEKTGFENAVGIIQELRTKAPEAWNQYGKPIAQSYWGTTEKDVAKADAWVNQKLYDLNLLPKDKKP